MKVGRSTLGHAPSDGGMSGERPAARQNGAMKRISTAVATLSFVLFAAAGCGSSKPSTAAPSTTAPASAGATSTSAAAATTVKASGGLDSAAFCAKLADETEKTAGLAAAIGTPQQAAKLAEIRAANASIVAAAPAELHAAIVTVYKVSELAQKALDPTLGAADKRAAGAAAAAAAGAADTKAAIATYKAWVQAHCGALSSKILSGGL